MNQSFRSAALIIAERPPWVVRVNGFLHGAGLLVAEHYVLTCAHLVSRSTGEVASVITIGFPFLDLVEREQEYRVRVQVLSPVNADDLALLEVDFAAGASHSKEATAPPAGALLAQLASPAVVNGHRYRVFGYPNETELGGWSYGRIGGPLGAGRVQLDRDASSGYPIVPGFSGSPIWDEDAEAVVGMVVAFEHRPGERIQVGFGLLSDVLARRATSAGISLQTRANVAIQPTLRGDEKPQLMVSADFGKGRDERTHVLSLLFSGDPYVSLSLADQLLTPDEDLIHDVVGRIAGNPATIHALRIVLSRRPDISGPLMVDYIMKANVSWGQANQVPDCLSRVHLPYCTTALVQGLDRGEPDVGRKCIEALGFMGARDYAFRLDDLLHNAGDYLFGKYRGYLLEAQARLFASTTEDLDIRIHSDYLRSAIGRLASVGFQSTEVADLLSVMSTGKVEQADHLISEWLPAEQPEVRRAALRALGALRLQRALPHIWPLLQSETEDSGVRFEAAMAAANIGGASAVDQIVVARDKELAKASSKVLGDLEYALSRSLVDVTDAARFDQLVVYLSEPTKRFRYLVYRAIGETKAGRFESLVRAGLVEADGLERGHAALALARLAGTASSQELHRAFSEAGSRVERVLTNLALRVIGESRHDPNYAQLRSDLAVDAFMYERLLRDDIVRVLAVQPDPTGPALMRAWQRIFVGLNDY